MERIPGKPESVDISSTNIVFLGITKRIIKNSIIIILEKLKTPCKQIETNFNSSKYQLRSLELSSKARKRSTGSSLVKSRHISTNMMQWQYGKYSKNQNANYNLYRHLRDLSSGTKKKIKSESVKFIAIPHFDGLAVKHLLLFARGYQDVMNYLPVEKEI